MKKVFLLCFLFLNVLSNAQTDSSAKIPKQGEADLPVIPPEPLEVFIAVQEMPEFPGGEKAMMKFITENLEWPEAAIKVEGVVRVKFIVAASGDIIDVKVISREKLGFGCEEAAVNVIKKMPKWKPGKQNGVPVNVYFNLPIRFKRF